MTTTKSKRLFRSESDKMIGGICAGLAKYFDLDPSLVRLVFVIGLVLGVSSTFWIYIILWLVLPTESTANGTTNDHIQSNVADIEQTVTKVARGIQSTVAGDKSASDKN